MENTMFLRLTAKSENESLARSCISAFILPLNPNVSELNDIKIVVSEAVTNAIVHGYPDTEGDIVINAEYVDDDVYIEVIDTGVGIENVDEAVKPKFTTRGESDRAGMGFSVMKALMDDIDVQSEINKGTKVVLHKKINSMSI